MKSVRPRLLPRFESDMTKGAMNKVHRVRGAASMGLPMLQGSISRDWTF
jgi:hypothetical protein